jgi:hypothetical protein
MAAFSHIIDAILRFEWLFLCSERDKIIRQKSRILVSVQKMTLWIYEANDILSVVVLQFRYT